MGKQRLQVWNYKHGNFFAHFINFPAYLNIHRRNQGLSLFDTQVELPKIQPNFQAPFLGFSGTAEIWNSRACMIGLIGAFIVELISKKGILQIIGWKLGRVLIFFPENLIRVSMDANVSYKTDNRDLRGILATAFIIFPFDSESIVRYTPSFKN